MTIQQIKDYLHAEGFKPAIKRLNGITSSEIIGLSFDVSPIVKENWLDFLAGLCAGCGYKIYYNRHIEEINIDL